MKHEIISQSLEINRVTKISTSKVISKNKMITSREIISPACNKNQYLDSNMLTSQENKCDISQSFEIEKLRGSDNSNN